MPRTRRPLLVAILVVTALALAGCVPTGSSATVAPSAADVAWGQAPSASSGTTFQSDVVLISGGGATVRSVSGDGFTWTLDRRAGGVDRLAVGKIMFVTGHGVGRVIHLKQSGETVAVTIEPVGLTDIIKDGHYATAKPVPFDQAAGQVATGAFWMDPDLLAQEGASSAIDTAPGVTESQVGQSFTDNDGPQSLGGPVISGASWIRRTDNVPSPPSPPSPTTPQVPQIKVPDLPRPPMNVAKVANTLATQTGGFQLTRTCCKAGTGTDFYYEKEGLKIKGSVALKMVAPTATFDLKIADSKVTLAEFKLTGAASLHAEMQAATSAGPAINATSRALGLDMDYDIPIGAIFGVPFSVTVSNALEVSIFMPGTAEVHGVGDYNLGAALGFRYDGSGFHSETSGKFNADTAISKSSSLAVGLSGITVTDDINFNVGIGFFGFKAGLDFGFRALVSVSIGAPIGFNVSQGAADPIERCRNARGVLRMTYGFGYTIPGPIVEVVNFFVKFFKGEPIAKKGGKHAFTVVAAVDKTEPASGFCK
jgi:hypothetical protein